MDLLIGILKLLLNVFKGASLSTKDLPRPTSVPVKESPVIEPIERLVQEDVAVAEPAITLDDWITSSGKYPERATNPELTYEIRSAAMGLVDKVNALFRELDLPKPKVSSGFRPSAVNATISGAAKRSGHLRGLAIDFADKDGSLDSILQSDSAQEVLARLGMWQEHPSKTEGWAHVDYIVRAEMNRPGCKPRQFMP
jgi:hypothetical protein